MGTKRPGNGSVGMATDAPFSQEPEKLGVSLAGITAQVPPMVAGAVAGALALAFVISGYLVSFGMMPAIPFTGFAWASTVEADKNSFIGQLKGIGEKIDAGLKGNAESIEGMAGRIDIVSKELTQKIMQVGSRVEEVNIEGLARSAAVSLVAMHERECEQRRAGNLVAADAIGVVVSSLQSEYIGYMGSAYPLRNC